MMWSEAKKSPMRSIPSMDDDDSVRCLVQSGTHIAHTNTHEHRGVQTGIWQTCSLNLLNLMPAAKVDKYNGFVCTLNFLSVPETTWLRTSNKLCCDWSIKLYRMKLMFSFISYTMFDLHSHSYTRECRCPKATGDEQTKAQRRRRDDVDEPPSPMDVQLQKWKCVRAPIHPILRSN